MIPLSYKGRVRALSIEDCPEGVVDVCVEADTDYFSGLTHLRVPEQMAPKLGSEILWVVHLPEEGS